MHGTPEQSSYLVIDQWIGINLAPVFTDLVVAFSDHVHPDLEQGGSYEFLLGLVRERVSFGPECPCGACSS